MTIDGGMLSVSAGTLEGSLVSPSDPGPPITCWYSLRAPPGHRVEIQLHRLVHIGTFENGTRYVVYFSTADAHGIIVTPHRLFN